jgi:hypothetical protein
VNQNKATGQRPWVTDLVFATIPLCLIASAICHWTQIDDLKIYRESMWIAVEMATMCISIFIIPVHLLRATFFLFKKKFKYAAIALGSIIFTIAAIGLANWFDAATLIYMT